MNSYLINIFFLFSILKWVGRYKFEPVTEYAISGTIALFHISSDDHFLLNKSSVYNYINKNFRRFLEGSLLLMDDRFNISRGFQLIIFMRFIDILYNIYPSVLFLWKNKILFYQVISLYFGLLRPESTPKNDKPYIPVKRKPADE